MLDLSHQLETLRRALWILPSAAILSAAMGYIRPVRRTLMPRSSHVIQTQVLLSVVGAMIIIIVAESLARAFAIVGAAGLVRYRANIQDPKDAGVLLVALAIGLLTGTGLLVPAAFCTVFVILVLWLLESLEPEDRTQFDLTVESKDAAKVRPHVEHALRRKGVKFQLWGSSPTELRYEVTVPFGRKLGRLSKLIRGVDKQESIAVDWRIRKPKTVRT
jgi:uncharacterized membrane protein YhiD involved in acid resistance